MEYIPGRSLDEILEDRLPTPENAAFLVEQMAEGLEAVYACGLIHRDIKPSNIVVGDDGVPRLVDFGLAAHLGSTALHEVAGTPAYMAPQQARGQWDRIDGRTDIYGLGAVLYALLTGHPPHPGETATESLEHARAGAVTPPRVLNRSVPPDLERIVMKALQVDPARRYATPSEFRRALRQRRLAHRYRPIGVAAALFVCALRPPPPPPPEPRPLPMQPQQLITVDRGGQALNLKKAAPIVSGDKLWIQCEVPAGWLPSVFWFDTEGKLTELAPLKITKGRTLDRLYYPPDGAQEVAGPSGTEFIFICARPSSRVSHSEVAALLPIGIPWPSLPPDEVVWVDNSSRGPGDLRPSAARDAFTKIEAARERLSSKVAHFVGVAFYHRDEGAHPGKSHGG
jgi:hypothetical protein